MKNSRLMIDGKPTIKCSPKNFYKRFKEYLIAGKLFKEEELYSEPSWRIPEILRERCEIKIPHKRYWSRSKDTYLCKMLYMTNDFSKKNMQSLVNSINKNNIQARKNKTDRETMLETRGIDYEHRLIIGNSLDASFYQSSEWRAIRYQSFDLYGNMCQCCGRTPKDGIVLHVDHVMPRVLKPELALDITNLQILCELCNLGKRADYMTDWRR